VEACGAVGAESQVTLQLSGQRGTSYRLCVDDSCDSANDARSGEPLMLKVPMENAKAEEAVHVKFTVSATEGSRNPTTDTLRVTLKKVQPNGPSCPPTAYSAALSYRPSSGLQVQ
jgi:hypothetical protein